MFYDCEIPVYQALALFFHTRVQSHSTGECLTLYPATTLHPPPPCGIHSSLVCSNITPEHSCQSPGFLIACTLIPTFTSEHEAFSLQVICKLIEKRMNAHWQREMLTATDLFCGTQQVIMNALLPGGFFYVSYEVWHECSTLHVCEVEFDWQLSLTWWTGPCPRTALRSQATCIRRVHRAGERPCVPHESSWKRQKRFPSEIISIADLLLKKMSYQCWKQLRCLILLWKPLNIFFL